jgi:hypothetical protein
MVVMEGKTVIIRESNEQVPRERWNMNMSTRIALSFFIALLLLCATAAANPEILAAHNVYRNEVGVVPLTYSSTLEASAQNWAEADAVNRSMVHSYGIYGENIAMGGADLLLSWTDVVNMWGSEKSYFIYGPLGDGSSTTGHWGDVGHYTQIVWSTTTQCGCGKATNFTYPPIEYFVCQYNPPGNWWGQYPYPLLGTIGVYRSGQWILDYGMDGIVDRRFYYGLPTDMPVEGDFNNDGTTDIGVYRSGQWILDYGTDGTVDRRFYYGLPTDMPVVGDFNDDGFTDIGVYRSGQWVLDYGVDGIVDRRFYYGLPTDMPVVGDFNNDGTTDIGVYRSGQWILDYGMDGTVDRRFYYGLPTDIPVGGGFNNDGTTDIGVYRSGQWILDYGMDGMVDRRFQYGLPTDIPIVGKWA